MSQNFDSYRFEQAVNKALVITQQVLGTERKPQLPSEVHHQYQDKFALVEAQLSAGAVCALQALQVLGLTNESLKKISDWANAGDAVSIRFNAETKCDYSREAKRDVEGPKVATETSVGSMISKVTTTKVITTVVEYFWIVQSSWSVEIFRGTGSTPADVIVLTTRTNAKDEVKTAAKSTPFVGTKHTPITASITWLAKALDRTAPGLPIKIRVDRTSDKCFTPRRNEQVDAALTFAFGLQSFVGSVNTFITNVLYAIACAAKPEARPDIHNANANSVFLPAILFEAEENSAPSSALSTSSSTSAITTVSVTSNNTVSSVLMDIASLNRLLNEAASQLTKQVETATASLPNSTSSTALITDAEARVLISCAYLERVLTHASDGVNYAEKLLHDQVIAAVGKVVQPSDFDAYMRFHSKRLFKQAFEPKPLCFSVRRSAQHTPEGTLRIDDSATNPTEQIFTISAAVSDPTSGDKRHRMMDFGLTAETRVQFGGEVHLHAWLSHRFSADPRPGSGPSPYRTCVMPAPRVLSLVASARQFSSFVLLVGKISSPTSFDPVSAIIVKDKDEITIPLSLSEIPTPKEFKDAIASLSPEQQRFCKAFRAMQLESTLFGVLVLHIKPQLEVLMNLAPDALTKEVELTQHLMDLFIQYQIPADLLSAPTQGPASLDAASRLAAVKANVAAVKSMISKAEDEAIKKREKQEKYIKPVQDDDVHCESVPQPQMMRSMMRRGAQQPQAAMMSFSAANSIPMAAPMMMMDSAPMMMMKSASAPPPPPPTASLASYGGGAAVPTSAPAPAPVSASVTKPILEKPTSGTTDSSATTDDDDFIPSRDLTKVPSELDRQYELHDSDSALRATIIAPEGSWTKKSVESILSKSPTISTLNADEQKTSKSAAFDLLDALSRSGGLPLEHAALHVVMGATHTFDESLIDTVVTNNMNPIEKSERSMLIMASTLHNRPAYQLVRGEHLARLTENTPALFLTDQAATH